MNRKNDACAYNLAMKNIDFEKLFLSLEAEASFVRYDFQISEAMNKLLELHKDTLSPNQTKKLEWEFLLFRLMTKNIFSSDGLKSDRFVPVVTFTDGRIFPNPNSFPEEAIFYFEERIKTSTNPIFRARYLDFLWEKSKSKNKYQFALQAIEQYLLTVDEYGNEDAIMERLDGLQRATELCLSLESKSKEKIQTSKVVARLTQEVDKMAHEKKYRWLIELFELVLALSPFITKDQIKNYLLLCDEAANHFCNDKSFHIQRSFLELKSKLAKCIGESTIKTEVDESIGRSFIDEAEAKSESGLVKVYFLQEAIDHYSKLGNMDMVKELTAQVKKATKDAIDNNEFKQFSSKVEIKPEDVKKMKERLGNGVQVAENMGVPVNFFPNWNHAVALTEKLAKEFVFQNIFPTVHYGQEYPIVRPQTPEEIQEDKVMTNFKIEAELDLQMLSGFLEELIADKQVVFDDFKKFFSKLDEIDHDTYESVLEGLESFFDGDHYRSVCILAPQLEDLLRRLLALFGGETTIPENGAFREKTLSSVLMELKPIITDPIYYYISWVMRDYRGFNLRNNVAHGFFKKKHGNVIYSTSLIHIFCLLIANTGISVNEK